MAFSPTQVISNSLSGIRSSYSSDSIIRWHLYQGAYPVTATNVITTAGSQRIDTQGHNAEEIAFVSSVFQRLDEQIEPEFQQVSSPAEADIIIYSSLSPLGETNSAGYYVAGYFGRRPPRIGSIAWLDYNGKTSLAPQEQQTIVHEIGHSLGLGHPDGDGLNPLWNTTDSIMSYRDVGYNVPTWFTDLDLAALKSIWGSENSLAVAVASTSESPQVVAEEESIGTSTINQQLVDQLADESVLKYKMFKDKEVSFYIDARGRAPLSKSLDKQGDRSRVSTEEAAFARSIFQEVDQVTGLTAREVRSPRKADIIVGSLDVKTEYGWDTYIGKKGAYADVAFYDKKGSDLGEREKVDIAESILYPIGLWNLSKSNYTTFDTVMSNYGLDYYGLTANDIAALRSLWGS